MPPPGADTSHPQEGRPQGRMYALARAGSQPDGRLECYLHLQAVQDILEALPAESVETGGLLAGAWGEDERGVYVLLGRALSSPRARGERLSFTFGQAAWEDLWAAQERECPELAIVGWYHTHPGLGVFLSTPDQFIHRHFFAEPYQVALVYDPATFTWGVFHWHEEELRAATGLYLYAETATDFPGLGRTLREIAPEGIMPAEISLEEDM